MKQWIRSVIFMITWLMAIGIAKAQTVVTGTVKDLATNNPLQSVSIYFKGGKGTTSDGNGKFTLTSTNTKYTIVQVSYVGYKTATFTIVPNTTETLAVALELSDEKNAVTVTTKRRGKYSNRNNPAVDLIRKVIDNKSKNKVSAYDFVQYEQYDKMQLSLTNKPEKLANNKLFKNYRFILENQDTTKIEGKALIPVYLEEKLSKKYYRKSPEDNKTYVLANKQVNFGEAIDKNGITNYTNRMYEEVDVYQNNISLLYYQFLSPIADLAPTFYRFYITDTVEKDGIKLVKLNFTPKNLNDILFRGTLFVTLDGNYAVQKLNMSVSKNANINFVRELRVNQEFEKGSDGRYHVINSNILTEFAISKGAATGILGERTLANKNFTVNVPVADSIFKGGLITVLDTAANNTDTFWMAHRSPPLTDVEAKVYTNIDSLQGMRSYKRFIGIATILLAGYKSFGWYDVGPVNAFYSFNPVEGFRLRAGGRTNTKLSKSIYFENYLAYGFKDEKFKYFVSGTYSLNHKSIYAFPLNFIRASFQHDTKIPGQELQFVQEDNFLLSFKRGNNDKWLYNDIFKLDYVREFGKNISYTIGFKNWKQTPAGAIVYNKVVDGTVTTIPNVTTTEISGELRWAPREQFYQGKVYRISITNKYPIFKLRYIAGIKGLLNSEYNYQNLNLNIYKRVYLSQLGFSDVVLEGNYIFGKVPYPLLNIHRANQTYSYQLNSFNMMNFMEFVSDHSASISVDHYFNGFFFNKIPLLKKLKLREVVAAKVLYGGIRSENDPEKTTASFKFPVDNSTNIPTTYHLGSTPYVEASAGIANIFKLLRVDFVKRFTYLNNPDITKFGVRTRFKLDF